MSSVDIADRVATITLNRPEARNALNRAVRKALPAAITACDADDDVDVMILTGADPAFSAGVDLKEFGSGAGGDDGRGLRRASASADDDGRTPFRGALPPHTKPLIGAVNGVAVTGGFEVALELRLPHRVRARPLRRHARARRRDAGLGAHRAARAAHRRRAGQGDEHHRQLHRRAARRRVGAREPRRAARRAAAVLPAARGRRGARTTSAACAA